MRRFPMLLTLLASVSFAAGLIGCAASTPEQPEPPPANESTQTEAAPEMEHAKHEHEAHEGQMMEGMKGLEELSADDRKSAMKQHMCPVSDEMLGSMGTPIKVSVKGQDVWICCGACKKKLEADPDTYLAKLKK